MAAPEGGEDVITKEAPAASEAGSTPDDLVAWFTSIIKDYSATFIIYYRGVW